MGGSSSGIPLTRSVVFLSQLLQSWGILSSLRTMSWLGAGLRHSWCLSVSTLGGVWILVCLVCPLVPLRGVLLFPHILILGWECFPLSWQGEPLGGPTCGPPVEAYAYMHKVNPNIFPHFLSFYLCITTLSLFTCHSNFFWNFPYFSSHSIHSKSLLLWHSTLDFASI